MTLDASQRKILRWKPLARPPERLIFEPRSDGLHTMLDGYWNGCRWVVRGSELVENVKIEKPAAECETGP